jgi:para-aminobenzoate synthetase component 1
VIGKAGDPDLRTISSICREPYGFWLDSALTHPTLGSVSFVGGDPYLILRSRGSEPEVWTRGGTHIIPGDPFEALRLILAEESSRGPDGGAVGYLAYEMKRFVEDVPARALDDLALPEMYLCLYEDLGRVNPGPLASGDGAAASPLGHLDVPSSTLSPAAYRAAVQRALDYIAAGDIYQVNLSQRFSQPMLGDPFDAYLELRRANPAPFAAYLNFPEAQVLSASPERFLRLDPATRLVETRPIKGTRPRGRTADEDEALAAELLASEKDRAENVMIVDLERNDLGRVADIGSVTVKGLCELESYATVHHLTSTVVARLREGLDAVDLLRATFPGGSITGAPKIRAMEIIDEQEPTARSVYTGAIGYFGFDGSLDLNIAIRTILVKDGTAHFQTGGGIVADSDPEMEYRETLYKGAALARVLASGAEVAASRTSP